MTNVIISFPNDYDVDTFVIPSRTDRVRADLKFLRQVENHLCRNWNRVKESEMPGKLISRAQVRFGLLKSRLAWAD